MAQVPECVVCLQPFDDFRHVPRVLACGHSFCELCLMQLQSAWQPSPSKSEDSPRSGAVIRCPECSHRTRLPVGGQQSLPKNVELLRLLPSLITEGDSTVNRGGTNSEKNGSRAEFEGNGSKIAATRRDLAEDGPGSRRSGERRPKGKGKARVDSKCSPGIGAESWLVPCDLYSDNFNGNARAWLLPEKAIKLREDSPNFRPMSNSERELLWGEIVLEQGRSSSCLPVTLLQLEAGTPHKETLAYEQAVFKAWEALHHAVRTELLILFRSSLVCCRLCSIFGLWMNKRNNLFLVSQIPAHENFSAWDTIIKSRQKEDNNDPTDVHEKQEFSESACARNDSRLSGGEMIKPELGQRQARHGSSEATMQILSRVGLGLCEALCEVHSQGLIFGLLSPNCVVLDRFGTLMIDVNATLIERSSAHKAAAHLSGSASLPEGHGSTEAQEHLGSQNSRTCWQYMSPEVISLLNNNLGILANPNGSAENGSGASDNVQGRLTCKADVWSLGCLLLELLSGKTPYHGLTFPEVLQKVVFERQKPFDFLRLDYSVEHGADCGECMEIDKHGHIKNFKNLLSKCFEYDPDRRPELDALWLNLMELASSNLFVKSITEHLQSQRASSAEQKFWMMCVPGFVLDGNLDSWHQTNADVQESQRHLEQLRLDSGVADDGRELQPCGLEQTGLLEGHQDYVTALVVCGDLLLSASFDKTIRVWSLEDHDLQQTLKCHLHVVTALAVDQDTFRCFSGDSGGKICGWKLGEDNSEPLIATWQEHSDWRYTGVTSLAVSADGILYSGSGDRTIKAWSMQSFNLLDTMKGHNGLVSALLVDGELLYSGSWDGTIHVWWRNDHSPVAVLGGGTTADPALGGVRTLCMSDSFLFAGRDNGAIQVWRDEECLTMVKAHDMVVSTLYVEGDFLYTGSWDQHIKAWKVDEFLSDPSPTIVKKCDSGLSSIVSDGDRLYAGLAETAIKVYSLLGDTWASLVQMLNP